MILVAIPIYFVLTGFERFDYFPSDMKRRLAWSGESVLVITPKLTEAAYSDHGFYWYYENKCDHTCLTVPIQPGEPGRYGSWSSNGVKILGSLKYPMLDDHILHKKLLENPAYLGSYHTILLLHNEYVTREIFDAVQAHANVIYLYPNSLYAQVSITNDTMTLIQGHGYQGMDNGFSWPYDNTRPDEFDNRCADWHFKRLPNGYQLDCYPEIVFTKKPEILLKVKDLIQ